MPFLEVKSKFKTKTRKNMPKKRKNLSFLRKMLIIVRFMTHKVWYNENTKGEINSQGELTFNREKET